MSEARHKESSELGAVLLTTLLVMSIMAALAVAIMDDIRYSLRRAANVQAYAQADWFRTAAEDFAQVYLEQFAAGLDGPGQNAALLTAEPILFPIDGGMLAFQVRDGSQCLSLSGLSTGEGPGQFHRLLENLGWSPIDAGNLTAIAQDWQDEDSQIQPGGAENYTYLALDPAYRTADEPFQSVSELRALKGMDEKQYQILRPFLCAGGAERATRINVNTLTLGQAPLLGAILGEDMMDIAESCIANRPADGYDKTGFQQCVDPSSAAGQAAGLPAQRQFGEMLVFEPQYIWVEADIQYLDARRTSVFEFNIDSGKATRTYRRHTAEARRPRPIEPEL